MFWWMEEPGPTSLHWRVRCNLHITVPLHSSDFHFMEKLCDHDSRKWRVRLLGFAKTPIDMWTGIWSKAKEWLCDGQVWWDWLLFCRASNFDGEKLSVQTKEQRETSSVYGLSCQMWDQTKWQDSFWHIRQWEGSLRKWFVSLAGANMSFVPVMGFRSRFLFCLAQATARLRFTAILQSRAPHF
jgi:hypothetical protein